MFLKKRIVHNEKSNVHFINGSVSLGGVNLNVYCFETDGVLIDTGAQTLLKEFKAFFAQADIEKIVISHFHEDHTGGAAFLQQEYGLPIYMNEMTIKECSEKAAYPLYRQLFWGKRKPFVAKAIGDTFNSKNAAWKTIPTPGHARGHLAFLNQETGQLFSGDLYVHPKTKVVLREESIPIIIQSIEKVLTYDFSEMFCCHAGFIKDGPHALTKKLNYLKELEEKVLSLYGKGYSAKEIQKSIFNKKYPITHFSFGEWNSIHMINSIIEPFNLDKQHL